MLFLPELKPIPRTHQALVSQAKTYDSGTPTLKRKRVSTIQTRSAAYQVSPSHHEISTNAYGPVVASAVDAVDGGAETASAVPNFSAESLQRLSNAISGDWHAAESPGSAASGPASEVRSPPHHRCRQRGLHRRALCERQWQRHRGQHKRVRDPEHAGDRAPARHLGLSHALSGDSR